MHNCEVYQFNGEMRRLRVSTLIVVSFAVLVFPLCIWQLQYSETNFVAKDVKTKWDLKSDTCRRIFIFFGTRPEIIKMAPLIILLRRSNNFVMKTVFTGQHDDMIDPFLKLFNVSVDIRFSKTFQKKQSLNMLLGKMLLEADVLDSNKNDIWVVQGDTSSALAIAIVGFHRKIRVAHIEAGLRTFDMYAPFPEEFNRKTISSIASINFAPTASNAKNLMNEGIDKNKIFITGNTVIDATKYLEDNRLLKKPKILDTYQMKRFVLVTLHRRENTIYFDDFYASIFRSKCIDCLFVLPVHPNPNAQKAARKICKKDERFLCIQPLVYEELHWMLKHAKLVISDSGGIQEEITWYKTPLLVLRNLTERSESIESGIAFIVNKTNLPIKIEQFLYTNYTLQVSRQNLPFGDGSASGKIIDILKTFDSDLSQKVDLPCQSNWSATLRDLYEFPHCRIGKNNINSSVQHVKNNLKESTLPTVAVILSVYKRTSLSKQLTDVVSQTYLPKTVVIVQNGHFLNVSSVIKEYQIKFKNIDFQHIAASKNLRFHWRFHVAFMQKEDYVSIWDDDVYAKKQWLEYSLQYSRKHNFAVVGANCRIFERIDLKANILVQKDRTGKCDFVGHSWTLPRQYLFFYIAMNYLTTFTGEDVQLAFALQQEGIEFHKPPMKGERAAGDIYSFATDNNSSWRKTQSPRTLLFCRLFLLNFKVLECSNCNDKTVLQRCLDMNNAKSQKAEEEAFRKDSDDNLYFWS